MNEYIYVIVHRPSQDTAHRYYGMSIDTISKMLDAQGFTGTVVNETDYNAFCAPKAGN